jgi:hypothetical protein
VGKIAITRKGWECRDAVKRELDCDDRPRLAGRLDPSRVRWSRALGGVNAIAVKKSLEELGPF